MLSIIMGVRRQMPSSLTLHMRTQPWQTLDCNLAKVSVNPYLAPDTETVR